MSLSRTLQTVVTRRFGILASAWVLCGICACKDLSSSPKLPTGTIDPSIYRTAAGALQEVDGTRSLFREALNQFMIQGGLLSDELTAPVLSSSNAVDQRQLPELETNDDATGVYALLQNVRVQADLGARALIAYAPTLPGTVRGEMYAMQGYSEIMLADLFCSGIPLTTLSLSGGIQYDSSQPRDSVFEHAAMVLDSAVVLTADNGPLQAFARVGRGRALLALGRYTDAAQAVSPVTTSDQYVLNVIVGSAIQLNAAIQGGEFGENVADREGGTGLAYLSSADPRTANEDQSLNGAPLSVPLKYTVASVGDSSTFVVASGIEARLSEAEAALAAGNASWLTTLNALRTSGVSTTVDVYTCDVDRSDDGSCPTDSVYTRTDTTWEAGSGGVSNLRPLRDPGTGLTGTSAQRARVDTLFSERAAWLFADGHRQGDLRRLLRQYANIHTPRYPTGAYRISGSYGSSVNAPIPFQERKNPKFHGCLDRNA